jgi:hypothetical protein
LFDITSTAVNGHQRNVEYPYVSRSGVEINNPRDLAQARNQQRNLDTVLQLLGMRTQVFEISKSEITSDIPPEFAWAGTESRVWRFTFEIEPQSQWTVDGDNFCILKADSELTPILLGLTETAKMEPWIKTQGPNINIIYYAKTNK